METAGSWQLAGVGPGFESRCLSAPCSGAAPWPPTAQQVVLDTPHFRAGPVVLPQVDGKGSAVAGAAGLPRSRCDINNEEKQGGCC